MKNVIIAGSRDYYNEFELFRVCDQLLDGMKDVQIISGGAKGADRCGESYGLAKRFPVFTIKANWDKYGKRAGYIRNVEMAKQSNALIAFWDGNSRGTAHMIKIALQEKLAVAVYNTKTSKIFRCINPDERKIVLDRAEKVLSMKKVETPVIKSVLTPEVKAQLDKQFEKKNKMTAKKTEQIKYVF